MASILSFVIVAALSVNSVDASYATDDVEDTTGAIDDDDDELDELTFEDDEVVEDTAEDTFEDDDEEELEDAGTHMPLQSAPP